ncbi:MAG: complex I subunit 5 family protein [Dethiobacteria bacterium]|jgi:proton-translocating NADH-quinone oxidoreductase chain M
MQVIEYGAVLFFVVPFVVLLINNILPKRLAEKYSISLAGVAALMQVAVAVAAFQQLSNHHLQEYEFSPLINAAHAGSVLFAVSTFSLVLLFCIGMVSFASVLVANRTVDKKRAVYVNLLMMLILGMNGMVMVTDLFSLYVFLEIVGISSFVLIAMFRTETGLEGAFKYLVMSVLASIMLLIGLAFIFMQTGSLQYAQLGLNAGSSQGGSQLTFIYTAIILMIAGFAIKTGVVPFHSWLPDAHQSANTAVSVLLSGVVIKVAGVYGFIVLTRLFSNLPAMNMTLALMGTISIIIGALFALRQNHFKRIVAYSSVSQMGYVLLGLSTGSILGLLGAVFHVFNHATFKSTLFTNAAALHEQTGTYDVSELGGLENRMGVTGFSSLAAFMSTAGIPPFAGFWSKLLIMMALWNGGFQLFAAIALFASIFTAAYFLRLQKKVFFGKLLDKFAGLTEIGGSIQFAQIMLTVVTIATGLFFPVALLYLRGTGIL